ncbi:unnamed protein product, partial [Cylicocyclus nassatus]
MASHMQLLVLVGICVHSRKDLMRKDEATGAQQRLSRTRVDLW